MSTYTFEISNTELRHKRCFECKFLKMSPEGILGTCTLPDGTGIRIKIKDRSIFSRKCSAKVTLKGEEI